jgi:hypothetical protein
MNDAKITGLWFIVECPHCHVPQVVNKWVKDNAAINLLKTRYVNCQMCSEPYFVTLTEMETELQ